MSLIGNVSATFLNKAPAPPGDPSRRGFLGVFGAGNREAELDAISATGLLYAIVTKLAANVSQVDWKLYRKRTDRRRVYSYEGMDERQEVMDHLALRVWNKPNPFMTRQEFVEIVQQHFELTGEEWWMAGRDPRVTFPTELWPLRPDRMDVVPHPEDFLSGYTYRTAGGVLVPLQVNEVIQVRRPHPKDIYRGISPVGSVASDLDSTQAASRWNRNFFHNSAQPGGVLAVKRRLNEKEWKQLLIRWNEQHKGVANAHRTAVIDEDAEWKDRTISQRDMQFVELRGMSNEEIRQAYTFPKPMLGTVEDVNRANAEAAEVVYSRWLLIDRLERIKQALNNDFLPMFGTAGEGVEFDYCNPTPDDRAADNEELKTKVEAYAGLVNAGVDPQAALRFLGLPADLYKEPTRTAPTVPEGAPAHA